MENKKTKSSVKNQKNVKNGSLQKSEKTSVKKNVQKNVKTAENDSSEEITSEIRKTEKSQKIQKNHPLFQKVVLRVVTIVTLFILGAGVIFFAGNKIHKFFTEVKNEKHEAMVSRQLLSCSELVTQKYRYSDIITLKKSLGFSKGYSIVKFSGILRGGIERISDIDFKIEKGGKKITLYLPSCCVLGNEIISQEVFDEKRSFFVPITTQEIFDEIKAVQTEIAEEIVGEGFLDEAERQTEAALGAMMYSLGFEKVEFQKK